MSDLNDLGLKLEQFLSRVENLENEKKQISTQIAEVYSEAKEANFDIKAMKKIVALRKLRKDELEEHEYILQTYKIALGMMPEEE